MELRDVGQAENRSICIIPPWSLTSRFFLLQSLDDDCTLEEEDDGLVEEEDEIDQFNDDTFGAGAIGESDFRIFVFSLRLASEINMIDQLLIMFQKSRLSNGN